MGTVTGIEDVKEIFSGTRGKVLLFGGGGAVLYLYLTRVRNSAPAPEDTGVDVSDSGYATDRIPPASGPGDPQERETSRDPETNQEWLESAVDYLVQVRSYSASAVYSALRRALDGDPLTAQEEYFVSEAISGYGAPPEGMPPITRTPTPPQTPPGGNDGGSETTRPPWARRYPAPADPRPPRQRKTPPEYGGDTRPVPQPSPYGHSRRK